MKRKVIFVFITICISLSCNRSNVPEFESGDIIFQISNSSQSRAIQIATKSKYSHMGIIYKNDDKIYVFEAVQPIKLTELHDWINRGEYGHFVVKRLKNHKAILNDDKIKQMKQIADSFLGKDYDKYFEWSDDRIYCSELVWKIYKGSLNIEIGKLQKMKDFDLSHPLVKKILKERFGSNIPLDETVISPGSIFKSDLLDEIFSY